MAARQERKVVTVLFADLVGFTSRAEQIDPEDVVGILQPYYARLRSELERHGGTVEKFIGDAVMGVFGAPVAHEDDPERAVRAALAIRDALHDEEVGLDVRLAVNTGEALVSLAARPEAGEAMVAGDVVNTAARLQAAAPIGGILVGRQTYETTQQAIEYRPAEPVEANGKADPVPAWEAVEARARFGVDVAQRPATELVGRRREVDLLADALARARGEREPQLVTLVGVPGIGKSRLVLELFGLLEATPELILWRQGRSLPYGEGVTFWALAEMVKAQAGILETDDADAASAKLQRAVSDAVAEEAEAEWIEGHLRPLIGLASESEARDDRRNEAFSAWRRFFEALADRRPLVLVFEDLHWADDGLLDFVDHLVDWASGVSILVVCTARPELLERRPGWGGGKRNSATISLTPLSDEDTARLLAAVLEQSVLPADTQADLLVRAGGNPLYAEQYARMFLERGSAEDLPLPGNVQGIIAARLDGLPAAEKELIQDAAVLGKVFWAGALTAIGGEERFAVEERLHGLERKEFVRRERRSSVEGETQHAFLHLLVRDVAYGQIPRAQRAEKHRLAARWIESLGRPEDNAEMLAYHYLEALELARAAGLDMSQLAEPARAALRDAGDRAAGLNAFGAAVRFYRAALDLTQTDSLDHPYLQLRLGRALYFYGEPGSVDALVSAAEALLACDDREAAAEAETTLGEAHWLQGDRDRAFEHLSRAQELVARSETTRIKAYVAMTSSRLLMLADDQEEALRVGREALAMTEELGLDELRAMALNNVGVARTYLGDLGGIGDLELAVELALKLNSPFESSRSQGNLAAMLWMRGELSRAVEWWARAEDAADAFPGTGFARWFRGQRVSYAYELGGWDEAIAVADEFLAEVEAGSPHYLAAMCYCTRSAIRVARDDVESAHADAEHAIELVRRSKDPQAVYPTLAVCAHIFCESDRPDRAAELAEEYLAGLRGPGVGFGLIASHQLAWTLVALGRGEELLDALSSVEEELPWSRAASLYAGGDPRGAAEVCASMGAVTEEAYDRLVLATALVQEGRRAEADVELQRALAFYHSVGASRYVRRGEALLAASA
jgi:class 3 adenylate cyclase/tetratricopeptide (TPR) repeat protein